MTIRDRLLCALLGHKYVVLRRFSITSRQVGCTRCKCKWGMHDPTYSLIPWDKDLEDMYRLIGQWKD